METHVARGSAVPHLCLQWEENKRTRERERDRESRRIGRGKGKLRRGQAQGKGCSRRSREVPAGGSSEPDRESTRRCAQLIVLGTRARVPFGCCCRGRLVHAMEPTWASRTRLRSCPCVSVVLEQILTRPSRTGCLYTRTLASPPSQGCVPALHPVDLLDQHTAGCKTPNGGIPVYQVPNKRSELMQFPRAEVKRDSWDTLELEVDRAKQVPHSRSRVASTAEQTSPLPTERKLATPRTHLLHHPCRCRDTEDRVSQILSIFCNYFQGGNKTGDDSKLQ